MAAPYRGLAMLELVAIGFLDKSECLVRVGFGRS